MNKKGDTPKQTIGDTMEKISDHVDSHMDQIKPVSRAVREAIKSSRNPHVEELTIGRTAYVKGMKVTYTREQAHKQQFLLRRMWAITLLANMRREGFNWEGIRKLTGKTRQTWDNVTTSGFVRYEIANMDFRSHETEQSTRGRRDERDKAISEAEYRPVTNGFIRNVCENIEAEGYTVWTWSFRRNFDMGLTIWNNNKKIDHLREKHKNQLIQERIGGTKPWKLLDEMSFENGKVITTVESREANSTSKGQFFWTRKEEFPLLDVQDVQIGEHNCWEYHMDIELTVYGYANAKTGEPDPRATTAFAYWEHQQQPVEDYDGPIQTAVTDPDKFRDTEEARDKKVARDEQVLKDLEEKERAAGIDPGGARIWTKVPTEPTPKAIELPEAVIKADDGSPPNKDIGGFWIQLPKTEVLPHMINAQRQVAFNVIIQLDENNKPTGSVTMHNPNGGFSVQGM